jgi:tRNA (mo5U34)-methyltransferase
VRTDDELRTAVSEYYWWHRIELRPGIVTPGQSPPIGPVLSRLGNLTGKTALDIGCWDGLYSFECERRGAVRVVASDLWEWAGHGAFDLAREELGSAAVPLECDVCDLPSRLGGERFDLVLFLGVLYHMRHPLLALEAVAACTKPGGKIIVDTLVGGDLETRVPLMRFLPSDEIAGDATNWWQPNVAAVCEMLADVGYEEIYAGPYYDCPPTLRGVFHAVKASDAHCLERAEADYRVRHQADYRVRH